MKQYLCEFMERYSYPSEAVSAVTESYEKVKEDGEFTSLLGVFYETPAHTPEYFEKALYAIAERESVNRYTLYLTYLLCLSKDLREEYKKANIEECVYFDTLEDLRYKLMECFDVEGVWGIMPFSWYYSLFNMRIFALGRMEYNFGPYRGEGATVADLDVGEGDMVLHIHIPSSGKPFDRDARIDSYERAYLFYKDAFNGKTPIFCCESWLLYPENKTVLGEKSNISSFIDDFKIVKSYEYPDNRNMWRIFGADADLPPSQLPRNTSLRRKIADWIEKGNRLGGGKGLFVYDPVTRKTFK